jgi:hypothetical protein
MNRTLISVAILLLASRGLALAEEKSEKPGQTFEKAVVYFEGNATDKDAEVLFEVIGSGVGLATLKVVAPGGRTVIDYKAPDSKLGLQHITLESPEPKNDGTIQADFPEGEYTFTGSTVTGVKLLGKAMLSHKLPDAASVVNPRADAQGVPVKGLQIKWKPVKNLAGYLVVIEQEESNLSVTAKLPGGATTFSVPDGFLRPGTEYKLAVGTVSKEGNTSLVETSFTTAGKK